MLVVSGSRILMPLQVNPLQNTGGRHVFTPGIILTDACRWRRMLVVSEVEY